MRAVAGHHEEVADVGMPDEGLVVDLMGPLAFVVGAGTRIEDRSTVDDFQRDVVASDQFLLFGVPQLMSAMLTVVAVGRLAAE